MGTMLENMGEKQSGFHIDVGILDNDACALEMISLLLRQRDAAIRIGWIELSKLSFGPLPHLFQYLSSLKKVNSFLQCLSQ